MPTLRNEFDIEQFERALQKLAHEQPRFTKVSTEDFTINFNYDDEDGSIHRIRVEIHKRIPGEKTSWGSPKYDYLSLGIERKLYMDPKNVTKIDCVSEEDKTKILKFIATLMGAEKPKPRFTLSQTLQHP